MRLSATTKKQGEREKEKQGERKKKAKKKVKEKEKKKVRKKRRKSQHRDFRLESSYILWHKTYVMLVPTGCEK